MHQGLDEEADRISGGLYNFYRTLVRTMSQIHAVHLNYSISDLKARMWEGKLNLSTMISWHNRRLLDLNLMKGTRYKYAR